MAKTRRAGRRLHRNSPTQDMCLACQWRDNAKQQLAQLTAAGRATVDYTGYTTGILDDFTTVHQFAQGKPIAFLAVPHAWNEDLVRLLVDAKAAADAKAAQVDAAVLEEEVEEEEYDDGDINPFEEGNDE